MKPHTMKSISIHTTAAALALLLSTAASTRAQTSFSDSLTGGTLPTNFNLTSDAATRAPSYSASGITMATNADGNRNYFRTNDTNYHTASFTAYITVTMEVGGGWGVDRPHPFFGIGTADFGRWSQPDTAIRTSYPDGEITYAGNPGYFIVLNAGVPNALESGRLQGFRQPENLAFANALYDVDGTDLVLGEVSTTALRMTYDAAAQTLQYDLDYAYAGDGSYAAFTSDQSTGAIPIAQSVIDGWAGGANSSLYFGGTGGTEKPLTFSNFTVILDQAVTADPKLTVVGFNGSGEFVIDATDLDPGLTYELKRGTDLVSFPVTVGAAVSGVDSTQFIDAAPPAGKAFYILEEQTTVE